MRERQWEVVMEIPVVKGCGTAYSFYIFICLLT
jgi:hypothetical protein